MGFFDRFRGNKPPPPALPEDAAMLGNDMVLAAMIGEPGHPIESVIAQAARGELTPMIGDASLYWTLCAVQASDTFQAARLAELLRYARIVPIDRAAGDGRGWLPPGRDEVEHWRAVVADATELHRIDARELPDAGPSVLCSRCYATSSGADAHVIPWWNEEANDLFTTYRCGACWLVSLDETRALVAGARFDDDVHAKFVDFFRRHDREGLAAELEALPRAEAARALVRVMDQLRDRSLVLSP
jgi:hypothetical protein